MGYLKGYTVKPDYITKNGIVVFTDGTNTDLIVNQPTCEAYGFIYDANNGVCRATTTNDLLPLRFSRNNNMVRGTSNTVDVETENTGILGVENTLNKTKNSLIVGRGHTVLNDNANCSVLGGLDATIRRQSEVAIGGGLVTLYNSGRSTSLSGIRQQSFIQLSGITTDNTATNLTVQGGNGYINVRNNSILGYEIYLTRFELGGTSGTAGNYSFREIKGAVQIDNSYNMAFVVGFTRNIAKIGVNGTFSMVDSSTSDVKSITVQVTDRNNVNNLWSASVYLHEVISTSITF
tara:strand:+ start:472 stop:1344 length:873 start_codon:yes stop_codon:yes gene_type:complete